jgi:hypothetical protein
MKRSSPGAQTDGRDDAGPVLLLRGGDDAPADFILLRVRPADCTRRLNRAP